MRLLLAFAMLCLLIHAEAVMSAASQACRLFIVSVLPGLMPYMVLSQMLVSRMNRLSPALILLLGWGGGSPTGAKLTALRPDLPPHDAMRLLISCATMSPMFLLGTISQWLGSAAAGIIVFFSVIAGGWLTGQLAAHWIRGCTGTVPASDVQKQPPTCPPLTFGASVETAARTMLLVCGTMVMLRVFAALATTVLPSAMHLPVTTLLEVTTGTDAIARLPLPLPLRTALIAGASGFGGMAIIMQNRAVSGDAFMPLGLQFLWQVLHGCISFLLALGIAWLL